MARDAGATKERLLEAGQHLFAEHGAFAVPLKQVVEQAGQRNASALHYHFGGRNGLLRAIIDRYNDSIEAERAVLLDRLEAEGRAGELRALVEAVVVPMSRQLDTSDGREFLRIVAQLVDLFDLWDLAGGHTPAQAARAFRLIEEALPAMPAATRRSRVTLFLAMVTESLALRARQEEQTERPMLPRATFVANLADMAVGALGAPSTAA